MPFAGEPFAGQPFAGSAFAGAPFAGQTVPQGTRILGPGGLLVLLLIVPLGGYDRHQIAAIERFQADGTPPPFGQVEAASEAEGEEPPP